RPPDGRERIVDDDHRQRLQIHFRERARRRGVEALAATDLDEFGDAGGLAVEADVAEIRAGGGHVDAAGDESGSDPRGRDGDPAGPAGGGRGTKAYRRAVASTPPRRAGRAGAEKTPSGPAAAAVRPSTTIAAPATGSPVCASSTRPPIDGPPWRASNTIHAENPSAAPIAILLALC